MAAYDAVTSLLHTLDHLSQTHTSHSLLYKKEQTEVLSDKYTFLKTFLDDFTNIFHEDVKMKHLERMIQEAANGVEDTIDSNFRPALIWMLEARSSLPKFWVDFSLLHIPHCENFPPNLKKLTLCRTFLQWEDMSILRKLPNLEVLKLKHNAFDGLIWLLSDEDEDGFLKLKFLLLENMILKQWEATSYHFPSLEHLVLTDCRYLKQIPFDFAEIQTLQLIELDKCMRSVLVSAEQIQEEQQSLGNHDLDIRVNSISLGLEYTHLTTRRWRVP